MGNYESAKRRSRETKVVVDFRSRRYVLNVTRAKKLVMKMAVDAVALALAATAVITAGKYVKEKVDYQSDVKDVTMEEMFDVTEKLVEADLHVSPINHEWNNNYNSLNVSEDDLYGFLMYLGKEESEKVVRDLGYEGWDNYLAMNGYFDKNGNPSIEVYKNYEESRLVNEYKENENGRQNGMH